ncbi:unnamed protein product, partial [Musa acuminata subsp. burmannicoides]
NISRGQRGPKHVHIWIMPTSAVESAIAAAACMHTLLFVSDSPAWPCAAALRAQAITIRGQIPCTGSSSPGLRDIRPWSATCCCRMNSFK